MKIRIEEIEAFLAIHDLRNFKKAAESVLITQSALSRRMIKLEDCLGTKLFDRTTRTIALTSVGQAFLPHARRMVNDFETSLSDIMDVVQIRSGVVAISSNMTLAETILPEVIRRYHRKHPNISVKVREGSSPRAMEWIIQNEVEFGMGNFGVDNQDLTYEPILEDDYVLICPPDYHLAARKEISWADLQNEKLIKQSPKSGIWRNIKHAIEMNNIEFDSKFEVYHLAALLGMVDKKLGIGIAPSLGLLRRPDLNLVSIRLVHPQCSRVLGIAKLRTRTLSPAANALRETIKEVLLDEARKRQESMVQ